MATLCALDGPFLGGYHDVSSGCAFVFATPMEQPRLWAEFLQGAMKSYGRFGVQSVLEYDKIRDGLSTAMFIAALDGAGRVVGGMRAQGRYDSASQAHAVAEWAGQPGEALLWGDIEDRLPLGVIEMKSGWVNERFARRRELTSALARVVLHAMRLMEVRFALCTVAQHAVHLWQTTGARVSSMIPPVAYPDDRYRTVPMWWDLESAEDLTTSECRPIVDAEWAELVAGRSTSWADSGDRAAA